MNQNPSTTEVGSTPVQSQKLRVAREKICTLRLRTGIRTGAGWRATGGNEGNGATVQVAFA